MTFRAIRRFLQLNPRQKGLLVEAQSMLLLARLALLCLPFRLVAKWLNHPVQGRQISNAARIQHINDVHWAVTACARSGLVKAVCFPQGLAAKAMLNRRGLAPTLYFGVGKDSKGQLLAHVWVADQEMPVIGMGATVFTVLDTFPPGTQNP